MIYETNEPNYPSTAIGCNSEEKGRLQTAYSNLYAANEKVAIDIESILNITGIWR